MTLVEPSTTSPIPTHRRRLSLKILANPFRRTPDTSADVARTAQPSSSEFRANEAVSASPLQRTSTTASSTAPKKLRRRSLSNIVKLSKPSVTKGEQVGEASAPKSTVDWAKRTSGHPLPPMPTSHTTERTTSRETIGMEVSQPKKRAEQRRSLPARASSSPSSSPRRCRHRTDGSSPPAAPLVVELDILQAASSTYSPAPPVMARPADGDLPARTALPFPSRPKPAAPLAPELAAPGNFKQERSPSFSGPPRPQLSAASSHSSHSSVDLVVWRFPTPPLRYHSSPDSSVASTPSSSPRRIGPTDKLAPASPSDRSEPSRPRAVQQRRPSSTHADADKPPSSPQGSSLATTTRKPITIRPQLGGPRVSASLLAKGIPVPAPAHGVTPPPRASTSAISTSGRSPVQPGWSATTSTGWPRPLLLVEGVKGAKSGELRHARSRLVGAPSSRGRGASASRARGERGELGERDEVEGDGMGAERRRYEAEADTIFTEARLKSLWAELGL